MLNLHLVCFKGMEVANFSFLGDRGICGMLLVEHHRFFMTRKVAQDKNEDSQDFRLHGKKKRLDTLRPLLFKHLSLRVD